MSQAGVDFVVPPALFCQESPFTTQIMKTALGFIHPG